VLRVDVRTAAGRLRQCRERRAWRRTGACLDRSGSSPPLEGYRAILPEGWSRTSCSRPPELPLAMTATDDGLFEGSLDGRWIDPTSPTGWARSWHHPLDAPIPPCAAIGRHEPVDELSTCITDHPTGIRPGLARGADRRWTGRMRSARCLHQPEEYPGSPEAWSSDSSACWRPGLRSRLFLTHLLLKMIRK
jgi:hypothetical protein